MAVKIVCRKGLYVDKDEEGGLSFRRVYNFDPPLHIYTIWGALRPPVSALQFVTNTTPYNVEKAVVIPMASVYTRQVYLKETSPNQINFQNVPFDGIHSSGISVSWLGHRVQPNYILNPTLTNPTSYDSCMISWAYHITNFTTLSKK